MLRWCGITPKDGKINSPFVISYEQSFKWCEWARSHLFDSWIETLIESCLWLLYQCDDSSWIINLHDCGAFFIISFRKSIFLLFFLFYVTLLEEITWLDLHVEATSPKSHIHFFHLFNHTHIVGNKNIVIKPIA